MSRTSTNTSPQYPKRELTEAEMLTALLGEEHLPKFQLALQQLYDALRGIVRSWELRYRAQEGLGSDVLQEAMIVLLETVRQQRIDLAQIRSLTGWFRTICWKTFYDRTYRRKEDRMRHHIGHEIIERFAVPSEEHPDAIMLSEERKELLGELFKLGNPECQKLVHLHYRDQMKYKDIVKLHGKELRLNTVTSARTRMRSCMRNLFLQNYRDKRFMAFIADEFEDMRIRELFRSNADHLNQVLEVVLLSKKHKKQRAKGRQVNAEEIEQLQLMETELCKINNEQIPHLKEYLEGQTRDRDLVIESLTHMAVESGKKDIVSTAFAGYAKLSDDFKMLPQELLLPKEATNENEVDGEHWEAIAGFHGLAKLWGHSQRIAEKSEMIEILITRSDLAKWGGEIRLAQIRIAQENYAKQTSTMSNINLREEDNES